jgi:nucleoid-associated protein YgaU
MIEGLFSLIFIWMFIGCVYRPMPSPPKSLPESATEAESKPAVKSKIPVLKKPMPSAQKPEFYVHTVRWSGETVSVIAQWYTGKQNNWEHIVKANSDLDPKQMRIGDKIFIPVDLLKTREPMPREYLENSVRKKNVPSPPRAKPVIKSDKNEVVEATETATQAAEFDEIELFHPNDIKRPEEKLNEIELFQPKDIEQTVTEPGEVELFQPMNYRLLDYWH